MIVRSRNEILNGKRDVNWGQGQSRRFLLERDGMGFTLAETTIPAGVDITLAYQNHLEACFCVEGEGLVKDLATGDEYPLREGVMYALDNNDEHRIVSIKDIRLISVFTPALTGHERHDLTEEGASSY
ncbi:L-ectoine synthase [Roseobacter sp. HKCCD9010]|uniref:ectoine synthase n=1 Tax=unclassified Roseobacter TaxID=196798 RepID=UPI001490BEF6|nr:MULTISPECIES: ectoine synthase [unclassified Roseobacter]MBF9052544.1 L-ectoine synthase [Rhodobacterales bacterium HKCCD4356]NNV14479.1 L-ectoine synthase [Roseobacter sp. HKCCD7357]NNV18750.1 L-ectoine synthase [Roseobacter sp. HKCCD8768]NNV28189.1 L-ectoine synthase [Roseobacter sp. HKCCD8192]NNV31922.1 L-ectoine synthase [Roseobacter sp. HKCCD9061]